MDIHEAIKRGDIDGVRRLLQAGVDLEQPSEEDGMPPLYVAAMYNQHEIAEMLLELGADLEGRQCGGSTPLHAACMTLFERPETAFLLIGHGANANAVNDFGDTPLRYAVEGPRNVEIVRALLERGADPNARPGHEASVLHVAVQCHNIGTVRLLLAHGADPNVASDRGETPLHEACMWNSPESVELLLAHGAALDPRDYQGLLPGDFDPGHEASRLVREARAERSCLPPPSEEADP